ncbi:MAG: phosphoribosylamine--glycine ligase [Phycisphaerae bacterium]
MNILLLGSGGREHAISRALARSPRLKKLLVMPGNAGTEMLATNILGDPCDVAHVVAVAKREVIDIVIVGPEDPLAAGVADALEAANIRVFGPRAAAAKLESDKAYAKELMRKQAIPTAEGRIFNDYNLACEYISTRDEALVVKAAGLAKGKGVIVCSEPSEALLAAERIMVQRVFGSAGDTIVVEERLTGREVSLMAIVDGSTIYLLETAQDYKRLRDGDEGPNTGGMGTFSPAPPLDDAVLRHIQTQIFVPIIDAMLRDGIHYRGVLYAGLMLTHAGPKVLEFNCRFGDPETQVLMMRLQSDAVDLFDAATSGKLDQYEMRWDPRAAVCIVAAAEGYPDKVRTGDWINGLPYATVHADHAVFHAGTKRIVTKMQTAGGRVLGITALGETRAAARERAYEIVSRIQFEGMQMRRDIGAE